MPSEDSEPRHGLISSNGSRFPRRSHPAQQAQWISLDQLVKMILRNNIYLEWPNPELHHSQWHHHQSQAHRRFSNYPSIVPIGHFVMWEILSCQFPVSGNRIVQISTQQQKNSPNQSQDLSGRYHRHTRE